MVDTGSMDMETPLYMQLTVYYAKIFIVQLNVVLVILLVMKSAENYFMEYLSCSDVPGSQMNVLLMKSLETLEDCCFDTRLEYK